MSCPAFVAVGHVTHDLYGDDVVPGGCAYYGAQTARGLGLRTGLVTAVGDDFACDGAFEGVEVAVDRRGRTTVFTNTYLNDGTRVQRIDAQAPPVLPALLPADWSRPDVVYLASVMGELDLAAWTAAVRPNVLGLGVQGWIKTAAADNSVVQQPWTVTVDELRGIDAACVSPADLEQQGDLLDRLIAAIPIVVVTHGRDGCEVITGETTTDVGIYPTEQLDPTGAGDTFAAAVFAALGQGASPVEAAQLGAAAASIIVEQRGGDAFGNLASARDRAANITIRRRTR